MADYPAKRATALLLVFPIYDSAGNFLSGAASLVSRISKDGAVFAATTNLVTEIGTDGVYQLTITIAENTADTVAVRITSTGKPVLIVYYTATRQLIDLAFPAVSGRSLAVSVAGVVDAAVQSIIAAAAQSIADEILNRNIAGGGSGGARIVRDAIRILRNKRSFTAGTLTVTQEDDVTPAWTAAVVQTAGDPLTSIDPA